MTRWGVWRETPAHLHAKKDGTSDGLLTDSLAVADGWPNWSVMERRRNGERDFYRAERVESECSYGRERYDVCLCCDDEVVVVVQTIGYVRRGESGRLVLELVVTLRGAGEKEDMAVY